MFDALESEKNDLKKHELALFLVYERPRNWKNKIEQYIVSLSKNSFYLFDIFNALQRQYQYSFASATDLKEMEYLIRMSLAKHQFGGKKPGLHQIIKIPKKFLAKRSVDDTVEE